MIPEGFVREEKLIHVKTAYSFMGVSEKLSYSSQFYFSNVFKKEIGMSPSAYKKQGLGRQQV